MPGVGAGAPLLSPCPPGRQEQAGCGQLSPQPGWGCPQSLAEDFPSPQTLPAQGWGLTHSQSPFAGALGLGCASIPREQLPALPRLSHSTLRAHNSCRSLCGEDWPHLALLEPSVLPQTPGKPRYSRVEQGGLAAGEAPSAEPGSAPAPHPSGWCPVGSEESHQQWSSSDDLTSPAGYCLTPCGPAPGSWMGGREGWMGGCALGGTNPALGVLVLIQARSIISKFLKHL